jgi:AcrR family transcriptional regulator
LKSKPSKVAETEPRTRHRAATEHQLVVAVGQLLAEQGPAALNASNVARAVGVDKALIYRYFGSFDGLIEAYARDGLYWPTPQDIVPDELELLALPFDARLVTILIRYVAALRARPETLAILAGELAERGPFQRVLENRREEFGLALFRFGHDAPPGLDLPALVTVLIGSIHYLLIRARQVSYFNGVQLNSDAGWQRIEAALALCLTSTVQLAAARAGDVQCT